MEAEGCIANTAGGGTAVKKSECGEEKSEKEKGGVGVGGSLPVRPVLINYSGRK